MCVPCMRAYKLEKWKAYKDKKNADRRLKLKTCPEAAAKKKEQGKAYREKNKEKIREASARYREENREKIRKASKAYYLKNIDKIKKYFDSRRQEKSQYDKKYREKNSVSIKEYWSSERGKISKRIAEHKRRRAKKEGDATLDFVLSLIGKQKGKCAACLAMLGESYHIDHIKPLSRGGKHENTNLQLLCSSCNQHKHAKDPIEFMQSLGKLL